MCIIRAINLTICACLFVFSIQLYTFEWKMRDPSSVSRQYFPINCKFYVKVTCLSKTCQYVSD